MIQEENTIVSKANNIEEVRIESKYQAVRNQTEKLCKPLKTEDYVVQPIQDVSPPKWHLAHTTWFFEQFILKPYKKDYQIFNDAYNYIFNSYYESMGEKMLRDHRGNMTRPSTEDVYQFRAYVDQQMLELINSSQFNAELEKLTELGLNHEQQHQELLITDIKYILGSNPLFPVYQQKPEGHHTPLATAQQEYIEVREGVYTIGYQGKGFHYDNEEGQHQAYLHNFRILNRLVTNREYLAFMDAGGYENYDLWLADGRDFVRQHHINAPQYWHKIEGNWFQYTLHGLKKVDLDAPVTHVSHYEADAFARWQGKRLPTEQEWETVSHLARYHQNLHVLHQANFVESNLFHPQALQADTTTETPAQMMGDVWEWTQSAYLPYPFYKRVEGALGEYNGKFMSSQVVLRGGSCATPESHIRTTYRNFFQPDKRWQFTGIRLAEYF
ncbi:ergothioneine biosynthesis protein EgtB [Catalinimonas alkaloidigena]|uniref:ergothioneine biosynthesis protein EgtB n=1 Tax=Catalinimonas alkaloidigena TaxID=1075417 RepID=UPI002405C1B3|nr:ergothioneine biosynthesis protein EgtB [Catalinimonas alkaloidigena]MDF9796735.1 ergothioneine biosynthesis protein EgtB [Catalinimonas alkaloidigena]